MDLGGDSGNVGLTALRSEVEGGAGCVRTWKMAGGSKLGSPGSRVKLG